MKVSIGKTAIEFVRGDVSVQKADAIVNAANSQLAGGGGVDGAIHARGGPAIMRETERYYPDGCPTGSAVISTAGQLDAKFVIHVVGPVWSGGQQGEAELLADAYRACLRLAIDHDCQSIAFPSLSTGAYGYPIDQAAHVALATICDFTQSEGGPALVRFVLFESSVWQRFVLTLEEITSPQRRRSSDSVPDE